MAKDKTIGGEQNWREMDDLIEQGLKRTAEKLIEKEKKNDGYLVIAGKDGKVRKVPARDL